MFLILLQFLAELSKAYSIHQQRNKRFSALEFIYCLVLYSKVLYQHSTALYHTETVSVILTIMVYHTTKI